MANPRLNTSGTLLATAFRTPGCGAVDLTNPDKDIDTYVKFQNGTANLKTLLAMGVLERTGSSIVELYWVTQGGPGPIAYKFL